MNSLRLLLTRLVCFFLCAGSLSAQENFLARFEKDAAGTWLVYPSAPGWHYTVQYSTDLALDTNTDEVAFTNEPDGYGYGTGGDLRFFVAPPPPPTAGGSPPVKPLHVYSVAIRISHTPGDTRVQVSGIGTDASPWSIIAPGTLPRDSGAVQFTTETATDFFRVQAIVFSLPATHITATAGPATLTPPQREVWDMVEAHWNDIIATLNQPNSPPEEPDPGPPGAPPQRRFLRVIKQATDSNGNGIADWWELQYGYVPFSVSGESGFLGQSNLSDTDNDGINNYTEGRCGLNPQLADSDGDSIPDILEDSDADGAINQSEILNRSTLWDSDTDDDGTPDGPDWFELIDGEFTQVTRFTPYEFFDPLADLPDAAARTAFRATVDGTLPAYNNQWLPPVAVPLAEGEMLLAHRSYQVADLDEEWGEYAALRRSRYRLRTGAGVPATGSPPPPVYVLRRTAVTSTAFGTVENFQIIPVDVSSGDVVREITSAAFPSDFTPYEGDLEEFLEDFGEMGYVTTITEQPLKPWMEVDANMDGVLNDADNTKELVPGDNRRLAETSRCLILDINNNNSDATQANSPTKDIHDHLSPDLDGVADAVEIVKTNEAFAAGHLCGNARVVLPRTFVEKSLRNGNVPTADQFIRICRTGDKCVRVHLKGGPVNAFQPYGNRIIGLPEDLDDNNAPDIRTGEELPPGLWTLPAGVGTKRELLMLVEGVASGICELVVEIRQYQGGILPDLVIGTSKVRIMVNVDQTPAPNINNVPGVALSGWLPHFAGVDYGNILAEEPQSASIKALRGRIRAEIPSWQAGQTRWRPQLTQRHRGLRTADQSSEFALRSTASFWCGVRTKTPANSPLGPGTCWVQTGLLFSQVPPNEAPNMDNSGHSNVEYYLETGRTGTFHNNVYQQTMPEPTGSNGSAALARWETKGILLDFIMFALPPALQSKPDTWFVVCKDARPGQNNYFLLEAGPPVGPDPGTSEIRAAIDALHKDARYDLPQVKMELSNSAGFFFGTDSHPGGVENLRYAISRTGTGTPSADAKSHWLWADGNAAGQAGFVWAPVIPENTEEAHRPGIQLTTGQSSAGVSLQTAPDHINRYFWHCRHPGAEKNTLEFFDERYWAFPEARR